MTWQELEERWSEAVAVYLSGKTRHIAFTEEEARELINLRKKNGYGYKSKESLWSKTELSTTPKENCSPTASGTKGT